MIVLDTNVVSEALKAQSDQRVERWLNGQISGSLYLTATSFAELRVGVEILPCGKRKRLLASELDNLLGILFQDRILSFDRQAAETYSRMVALARALGKPLPFRDCQIAAIAAVHGFTVATRDTSPFEAAGVPFMNPWEA
jgi:predicted nucleic acid-binding protein